jgi:hypothetical protein
MAAPTKCCKVKILLANPEPSIRPNWVGLLRHYLIPTMASVGPLTRRMRDFLTGLDHSVRLH